MKPNKLLSAMTGVAAASMLLSSCIGSFSLSNKLLTWNKTVGNKFANEAVFVLFWILPAYEVSIIADLLVLNTIEFWSGNKPLQASTKTVEGNDGKYVVVTDSKGYTITSQNDGIQIRLDFSTEDQTWSYRINDKDPVPFMTFIDDNHVSMPTPDGSWTTVELSRQGIGDFALAY